MLPKSESSKQGQTARRKLVLEVEEGEISDQEAEQQQTQKRTTKIKNTKPNVGSKRKSVEDIEKEIQEVNRAVAKMQKMMEQNFAGHSSNRGKNPVKPNIMASPSESTIYHNVIGPKDPVELPNRLSSSSEEGEIIYSQPQGIEEAVDNVDIQQSVPFSNQIDEFLDAHRNSTKVPHVMLQPPTKPRACICQT